MSAEHREPEADGCPGGRHVRDALCAETPIEALELEEVA